jgi:hypothetical protein
VSQLANFYGVRYFSAAAVRSLNAQQRFAAVNPLLLLGRPDAVETDDEVGRLTIATVRFISRLYTTHEAWVKEREN